MRGPHHLRRDRRTTGSGFTLAEVAITLLIVGFTLLLVLQGLRNAKSSAAHSAHRKVAGGLALLTLADVESGLYWEDFDGRGGDLSGNYAEEGYEDYSWELIAGDGELFDYEEEDEESPYFDNFRHQRYLAENADDYDDDDTAYAETGSTGGPYERVMVRVTFPKISELSNQFVLERWVPLEQVFGRSPDAIDEEDDQ